MYIVRCFIEFLLSILESMSQLLPRSSHSPPAQPQLSQSIDLESLTPVPVVARQNIEQRNLHINMDIVHRFKAFLLSILGSRSPLLPTSSHSPPTLPQPSQTTELESPTITPVPDDARQNIEQRNLQWQDIILGFCFTSAHGIALQFVKTPSQLPPSFHLLSLALVLTFSAVFVAKLISPKFPDTAQVVEKAAVFFAATAFFLAISIPLSLNLKFFTWAIYGVLLLPVFIFSFF